MSPPVAERYARTLIERHEPSLRGRFVLAWATHLVSDEEAGLALDGTNVSIVVVDVRAWRAYDRAHRAELIAHEVAHLIVEMRHPRAPRWPPHGRVWRAVMRELGYPRAGARIGAWRKR